MIQSTGANPSALNGSNTRAILQRRASLLAKLRQYFSQHDVLEVETPVLREFGVSDPQVDNLSLTIPSRGGAEYFLQTSPEYAMKQLLANGSGSIFQICKAFRDDPSGRLHHFEFTMLEWYRLGFEMYQLIEDVGNIASLAVGEKPQEIISYREAFVRYADIDPFTASLAQLREKSRALFDIQMHDENRDVWLDLLHTHLIEPNLGCDRLTFLVDYPASQAALATTKKDSDGFEVAERFELYINGVEIANGYHELIDLNVHKSRHENNNALRKSLGKRKMLDDEYLLGALRKGIPQCAGVALGLDRLLMVALAQNENSIHS